MTVDDRRAAEHAFNVGLGARLRQARTDRGLSLTAAEEQSNGEFKASALGCYERGERSITAFKLYRLGVLYDVPCTELLGDSSSEEGGHPVVAATIVEPVVVGAEEQAPATISPSTPLGDAGQHRVVLVVDDEASTRELVTTALKLEGYETMSAADGVMALEILSRCRFDAIVLDTVMPRMDGLTVLRTLRSDPATADTPVLVLSGLADIGHLERAVEAGASGYVTKPFEVRGLLEQIARLVKPSKKRRVR
jgi:CheY-like chemotaxis protein/transcriptional regulator with XRE-family HTH domain